MNNKKTLGMIVTALLLVGCSEGFGIPDERTTCTTYDNGDTVCRTYYNGYSDEANIACTGSMCKSTDMSAYDVAEVLDDVDVIIDIADDVVVVESPTETKIVEVE